MPSYPHAPESDHSSLCELTIQEPAADEGGPQKKAKSASSSTTSVTDVEWVEAALSLLRRAQKHSRGWYFNEPVDPVAMSIPDYFDIIKEPMDFGTIAKKIKNEEYTCLEDFAGDMRLIFNNAFTYNAENDEVWKAAKTMSNFFEEKWAETLATLNGEDPGDSSPRGGGRSASKAVPPKASGSKSGPLGKEVKGDLKVGQFYLKAVQEGGWKAGAQMLLKKLQDNENAWPFMTKLPDTEDSDKIKKHMDLPTISQRLQSGQYIRGGRKDFLRDARTIFSNAISIHNEDSQMHVMARNMSAVFELEWASLELILSRKESRQGGGGDDGGWGFCGGIEKWEPLCEQLLERLMQHPKGSQVCVCVFVCARALAWAYVCTYAFAWVCVCL